MNNTAIELLAELAEAKARLVKLKGLRDACVDEVLTDEQKAQIKYIDDRHTQDSSELLERMKGLEESIRSVVAAGGMTVKVGSLMAVWNKPRVSWDGKALEGYGAAHPEIMAFRSVGEATVTIREAK